MEWERGKFSSSTTLKVYFETNAASFHWQTYPPPRAWRGEWRVCLIYYNYGGKFQLSLRAPVREWDSGKRDGARATSRQRRRRLTVVPRCLANRLTYSGRDRNYSLLCAWYYRNPSAFTTIYTSYPYALSPCTDLYALSRLSPSFIPQRIILATTRYITGWLSSLNRERERERERERRGGGRESARDERWKEWKTKKK